MRPKRTARTAFKNSRMIALERQRGCSVEELIRRGHDAGLTQEEIAQQLGISRPTLSCWMRDLGVRYRIEFDSEQPVG